MSFEAFAQQPEALSAPFNEFILKTANGCNMQPQHELDRDPLALIHPGCDHCYMYTHSSAWQEEPDLMEPPVLEQAVHRIAEHASDHRLAHVRIIAHGGEPLLTLKKYPNYYTDLAKNVHEQVDPIGTKAHLFIQTNGLLINDRQGPGVVDQLQKAGFTIGLSIDGPQVANDLHRRDKAGRSTHSRAEKAANLLHQAGVNWGVLGVIDPRTNPEEVVEYLASLRPQSINLFPLHANHSAPPLEHPNAISLGEWQKRAFDRYNDWHRYHPGESGPPFTMPIYDNYLQLAFGAWSRNDTSGDRTTQELIITPGGKFERLDTLKSTDDGAVFTGRNIFEHSIDEMRFDPGIAARRMGFAALSPLCQGCEVLDLCFGNHYPNRYQAPEEPLSIQSTTEDFIEAFQNPSAHCVDHRLFLGYINKLVKGVPKPVPIPVGVGAPMHENSSESLAAAPPQDMRSAVHEHQRRVTEQVADIPFGRALVDSCSSYQSFPLPLNPCNYRLRLENIETAFKAIQDRKLTGRAALMTASMIAQSMHAGPVTFYAGEGEDRVPADYEVVMLSKDYNDAIVNSIFAFKSPHFTGIEMTHQKAGDYWFITREQADKLMEHREDIIGYVVPAQLPTSAPKDFKFGADHGIDYWHEIFFRTITSPIPVTVYDLPGDLLVVDTPGQSEQSTVDLVQEAASSISAYKNPELLGQAFEEGGRGTITPLWGSWPSKHRGKSDWQSQPHMPTVSTKFAVSERITNIIDSQIGNHDIPRFQHGPFYKDLLEEEVVPHLAALR